jgi:hypothetical protein
VKIFNAILKEAVQKQDKLHWLDFFDKLLSQDGKNLDPRFNFDGTHLNPCYVPILEDAMNSI